MRPFVHSMGLILVLALLVPLQAQPPQIPAKANQPSALGFQIQDAERIVVLEVDKADRERGTISYKKVKDLKGNSLAERVEHRLGVEFPKREWQAILQWARKGRKAVVFEEKDFTFACIGNFWYLLLAKQAEIHQVLHNWPQVYVGSPDDLCRHIEDILDGKKVEITAQAPDREMDGFHPWHGPCYRDWLRGKKGRVWRIKAGKDIHLPYKPWLQEFVIGWGSGGTERVPTLVQLLKNPDPYVRAEAAEDLGQLGKKAAAALSALQEALKDSDGHVRIFAAEAIARINPKNDQPLGTFLKELRHKDAQVREAAAIALATLIHPPQAAVPALVGALLQDGDAHVRAIAAFALCKIRNDGPPTAYAPNDIVAALAKALQRDTDEKARYWSVQALAKFGAEAWRATEALSGALASEDYDVAGTAADILSRLDPPAIMMLAEAAGDPNCRAHWTAAACLGNLGPRARCAVPALRRAAGNGSEVAACALLRIAPKSSMKAILLAVNGLGHYRTFPPSTPAIIQLLEEFGPEAAPLVPALRKQLEREYIDYRNGVIRVLGKIGPAAKEVAPHLTSLRNKGDITAAAALWRICRDQESLSTLRLALKDKETWRRCFAAETIAELDGDSSEDVKKLRAEALRFLILL